MTHDVLYLPGPTEVRAELLAEMARPMIGHRSQKAKELVVRLVERLPALFCTRQRALFESVPATMLMEAAIRNLVAKRVLVTTCGAFSERWLEIARACGREADALSVEWGEAITPQLLDAALARGGYDAVTITHNETSTGVINPLRELAAVARKHGALVLVDVVSSLAGARIEFDAWDLDLAFAGVQKCVALPPGIVLFALSERALAQAATVPQRGFLLDFPRTAAALAKGEPIATPSLPHLFALEAQLDAIAREGLDQRWARHARMAARTRAWASERSLAMFSRDGFHSPTVSTIRVGPGEAVARLASARKAGFVVSNGYGKLKDQTIRVGHMGDHTEADLECVLAALDAVGFATGRTAR
jgi:aspartate aminotransferase-like enzyme